MNAPAERMCHVDPAALPIYFDAGAAEVLRATRPDDLRLYDYDAGRPRADTFVIDTSATHGLQFAAHRHVFSPTQIDTMARYQCMGGRNVYHTMG